MRRGQIRILLFMLPVMLAGMNLYSQGIDLKYGSLPKLYVGFSGSYGQKMIVNDISAIKDQITATDQYSYSGTFEIGYFFKRFFGLSTGISYNPYSAIYDIKSYSASIEATDIEGDDYTRIISGTNITETQNIEFISIPFFINLYTGKGAGFHLQGGINLSIPRSATYTTKGKFSYSGTYPEYNVTIFGVGHEGFYNDQNITNGGELQIRKTNPELIAAAGFHFVIQNSAQLSFSAVYNKMLSDISEYPAAGSFILSDNREVVRSIMSLSSETITEAIGAKVTLRFFIRTPGK